MVGVVNKIWLIRESKGSDVYYLTGDEKLVEFFKTHRRHWGNLIWTRGLQEDRRYSYWAQLWLLKTYLVVLYTMGNSYWFLHPFNTETDNIKTDIGSGLYSLGSENTFKDTWRFDFSSNYYATSVIKSFHNRLRFIEGVIWNYRNLTGECSLDWSNIKFLIEPRYGLPKDPEGPYDRWRMPEPSKKHKAHISWIARILKKIKAAY